MEFEFVESTLKHKIKVVGIGGAGNNAVNNMITSGLEGVAFISANTDLQDLENSTAPIKLQLGAELTKGLGCGADPEVGRAAAMEDEERIKEILGDADMVFVTAGMGGGTGTGGAPVVAECLKSLERKPLTVAVVTKPFHFEGGRRMRQAEEGIERLKEFADTIITIPNDRLISMAPRGCSIKDAFRLADDVLLQAVKGVSDLILLPGFINVDFKDAEKVMSNQGQALMGTGIASGPDRAQAAAQEAISSPLLEDISIEGAQGLLINISCAENNVTLEEVNEACSMIQKEAHPDASVIFGVAWDNTLEESLRITVIATGIGVKETKSAAPPPEETKKPMASLEEVSRKSAHYERPAVERRRSNVRNLSEFERPQYTKYESFIHDDEDLERPTFMRRKAD
jgi:cell division protein FtsZ